MLVLGIVTPTVASGTPASAGVARRRVTDSACSGRTARVITAPKAWLDGAPYVATTMLPSGVSLVVISSGYPAATYIVVHAFTPTCAPERSFGRDGVEQLSFGGRAVSVSAVVPASGGGAILAGASGNGWLVARVAADGRLDRAFGHDGWSALHWAGSASAVTDAPSGEIVVGGSSGSGCCVVEHVGELNRGGAIITSFGSGGRTRVAPLEDSGIERLAIRPDGDILSLTEGGLMGCWSSAMAELTPSGAAVPSFVANFHAAMARVLKSSVFVADLVADGDGFHLIGTGQKPCVSTKPSPTVTGRVVAFQSNGELQTSFARGGDATFASPMQDPVWALPQPGGRTLMVGEKAYLQVGAHARLSLNLVDLSATGAIHRGYGDGGRAVVRLPFLNGGSAAYIPVAVASDGRTGIVVSSSADGTALELQQFAG
jgi:hypothetical protein